MAGTLALRLRTGVEIRCQFWEKELLKDVGESRLTNPDQADETTDLAPCRSFAG